MEEEDLQLLDFVIREDVEDDQDIDFGDLEEEIGKTAEECERRWRMLLKGLGGLGPGMNYKASQIAAKMLEDIKTKHERYVPWQNNRGSKANRNGFNKYVDILGFYRKNYA